MTSQQSYCTMEKYSWEWHFFNGLGFGVPVCCVLWFCSSWMNMAKQNDSLYMHLSDGNPYAQETDWNKYNQDFIKCPDCLITDLENS